MERSLAHIEKIEWIKGIEGADRIELVGILGWQCVAGKGEFKIGDLCVYHEIDSKVPIEKDVYAFLANNDGKIKTRKFKGCLSQGLALALDKFDVDLKQYKIGEDVTELLGIKKIQTDEEKRFKREGSADDRLVIAQKKNEKFLKSSFGKWCMRHKFTRELVLRIIVGKKKKRKPWPDFVTKTDEERIENIPKMLSVKEPLIATEKIDGTSTTFFLKKNGSKTDFGVCSRNLRQFDEKKKKYLGGNLYWDMAFKYDIEWILLDISVCYKAEEVILQGETIGVDIQKNHYRIKDNEFYAFNLIIDGKKHNPIEGKKIMDKYNVKWVPIIDTNFIIPDTMEEMKKSADGNSLLNPNEIREGCVYRSYDSKISFKNVSNNYLLKNNG